MQYVRVVCWRFALPEGSILYGFNLEVEYIDLEQSYGEVVTSRVGTMEYAAACTRSTYGAD